MGEFFSVHATKFFWRATLRRCHARMRVFCLRQRRSVALQRNYYETNGQALVEFVIILTVIMAVCAGMLFSSRLLTFDFWAQQEARFLAFEQTWVPAMAYSSPTEDPKSKLDDSGFFRRPNILDRLDETRDIDKGGSVTQLLAQLSKEEVRGRARILQPAESPQSETPQFVETAYASQLETNRRYSGRDTVPAPKKIETPIRGFEPRNRLEKGLVSILHTNGFGQSFCALGYAKLAATHAAVERTVFGDTHCADTMDVSFGVHMARNLDFKEAFRDYGLQLASGFSEGQALEGVVRVQVASQFYSFFDTTIRSQVNDAITDIDDKNNDEKGLGAQQSVSRLQSSLRYTGSSEAVQKILDQIDLVADRDPHSRSREAWKTFEDDINEVLHYDADKEPIVSDFLLSTDYLPVPPKFGAAAGGLFSGIMKNAIFYENNASDLEDSLIDNSNKDVTVSYMSDKGAFPYARRHLNTQGHVLTAHFYLVTQPWHITRQQSAISGYRQLGTQFDDKGEETEEGVLRRRVLGFWLFPSDPVALLDPMVAFVDLGGLTGVLDAFRDVGSAIGEIKGFLTDNPILDLFDALSSIPGFGEAIPTLPKWPAVRPQAYPYSQELDGDKLMGAQRTFDDYLKEQRKFNPKPDPDFGDSD